MWTGNFTGSDNRLCGTIRDSSDCTWRMRLSGFGSSQNEAEAIGALKAYDTRH